MKHLILLFFFCISCTSFVHEDVLGSDEFIMDSYKICEGKSSILQMRGDDSKEITKEYFEEYQDIICEKDVLGLSLYHPKREDLVQAVNNINTINGFTVKEGKILLPYLDTISIKSLTIEQAKQKIEEAYSNEIEDVKIFLKYKKRQTQKVHIIGNAKNLTIEITGKSKLYDVLEKAQVSMLSNFFRSYVLRDNKHIGVDIHKLLIDGDMSQNIIMKGGDKIFISDSQEDNVIILGDVSNQTTVPIKNGAISVKEAIAHAKGLLNSADKSSIYIIRGSLFTPKIYMISFNEVMNLPNKSMMLMAGDVLYISSSPLSEWNKIIAQVIPSLTGFDILYKTMKNIGVLKDEK